MLRQDFHNDINQFRKLPADVLALILSKLSAREIGLASSVSQAFNRAANNNLLWKRKFAMYFRMDANKFEEPVNWKKKFEEFYKEKFKIIRKFDNNQLRIVDAIFENDLAYILKVRPEDLRAVIESLFQHKDIILNPQHVDMNNYIYSIQDYSNIDFRSWAIMCHQPFDFILEIIEPQPAKMEHLVFAVLAGREDVVNLIRNLPFKSYDCNNISILHFFARHRRMDLYTQFQDKRNVLNLDRYEKMTFEYFELPQILELLEGGYLDAVLSHYIAIHHLFKIIVANNDSKALDIVMTMLAEKSDLNDQMINYELLKAIARCNKAEVAYQFLAKIDISRINLLDDTEIYNYAIKSNNYKVAELYLTQNPGSFHEDLSYLPHMSSDILNLTLNYIDPRNPRHIAALHRHLFNRSYNPESYKKIIDKLNESHTKIARIIANYDEFSLSVLENNNTGYVEYLGTLDKMKINGVGLWIKRGLITYLQNNNVSTQALLTLLANEKIIKAMTSDHHTIANCLLHNGMYKEFQIYMDTIQSCFPIKYKCLLKRILHDSVQQGLNRVEAVLERNPKITPSIFRTVRNHALNPDEISLALKKNMIKTYISNCESQNSNPTHCKLFRKLRQSRGFTKQEKLAYAKHVLAYLEDKSGAPDNQKKISKTGELGKIMRHIRR